jgi:hypothetical protein
MNGEATGQRRAVPARMDVSGLPPHPTAKRKSDYFREKN